MIDVIIPSAKLNGFFHNLHPFVTDGYEEAYILRDIDAAHGWVMEPELKNWMKSNIHNYSRCFRRRMPISKKYPDYFLRYNVIISFSDEADALLFKMRWL